MRLKSDLIEAMEATIDGRLCEIELVWDQRTALCVVLASGGYPGPYEKGKPIGGLDAAAGMEQVEVFHAGTAIGPEGVLTAGGRVLGITAMGDSLQESRERAYDAAGLISFDGAQMRGDIGMKTSGR